MALEGSIRNKTVSSVRSRLVGRREGIIGTFFTREGRIKRPALQQHALLRQAWEYKHLLAFIGIFFTARQPSQ
jgi:hypothetical protein